MVMNFSRTKTYSFPMYFIQAVLFMFGGYFIAKVNLGGMIVSLVFAMLFCMWLIGSVEAVKK